MKRTQLYKHLLLPITACLSVSLAGSAFAQDADNDSEDSNQQLEEVMVTARKREERLQDIPTSASALTADFMENMNPIETVRELTDLIPGLTMNDVNLNFIAEPSIRGGGASELSYAFNNSSAMAKNSCWLISRPPSPPM